MFTIVLLFLLRRVIHEPSSIWIDNFNLCLFASKPTLASGALKDGNWTAFAVHKYCGPKKLTMKCVRDKDNAIVPAMPLEFDELIGYACVVWKKVEADVQQYGRKLRQTSLFYRHKVSTVPVRPILGDDDEDLTAKVKAASKSFSELYPWTIEKENIGSTRGFQTIFSRFYKEWIRPTVNGDRYFLLNADVAIYYQMMRVCLQLVGWFGIL
jgi:hypothetical protein